MEQERLDELKEILIEALESKGYTDGVDVNAAISLFEYGILRNPKTNDVIYCSDGEGKNPKFDWTTVGIEDVREALNEVSYGYFSFVGTDKQECLYRLDPNFLTNDIHSLNMYDGHFDESCTWDMTIEDAVNRINS